GHAVLFCNFLGQMRFLDEEAALGPSFSAWKAALPALLRGRSWASFHDRLSGEALPRISEESGRASDIVPDAEVLSRFYASDARSGQVELLDHLTGDLFPGAPRRFIHWELTPRNHHLIEAVF